MSLEKVFHRVRQNFKYCDFYRCNFFTWDHKKDQMVLQQSIKEQRLVFLSIGIHGLNLLLQIVAIIKAPKSSLIDTVQAVGITTILLVGFLLRLDLQIDYVPLQLFNYIYGLKSKIQHFSCFLSVSVIFFRAYFCRHQETYSRAKMYTKLHHCVHKTAGNYVLD
jgi:hypothetical protein